MPKFCKYVAPGNVVDIIPGVDVTAGQVRVVGTRALIMSKTATGATTLNTAAVSGLWDIPQAAEVITAGGLVYWNATGNPVGGTPGTGAATMTVGTNRLLGTAAPLQPNGTNATANTDEFVRVSLGGLSINIATLAGAVTLNTVTGLQDPLAVTGLAAAAAGNGGALTMTGGLGHTNGNGGATSVVGGAGGAGTGNGGAVAVTGGASGAGATGTGGNVAVTGGAAASTNGAGGAASVTGGAGRGTGAGGAASLTGGASGAGATGNGGSVTITGGAAASTNGNGGNVSLVPGALAGTGAAGKIHLNGFVAGMKALVLDMADAQVALTRADMVGNWMLVDPNSSGAGENLLLPPEADMADVVLFIVNTGGENIVLQNDAAGAIGTIATTKAAIVHCDGTDWTIIKDVAAT